MSRHLDVVHLSGDEYDRLMDEREILRQECERAWKEVDAIQRERDDHLRWRQELADKLDELEKHRDALKADAERLASLAWPEPFCDEYNGIDLHEQASIYASALGREEPNRDDYLAALRCAIDAARGKE